MCNFQIGCICNKFFGITYACKYKRKYLFFDTSMHWSTVMAQYVAWVMVPYSPLHESNKGTWFWKELVSKPVRHYYDNSSFAPLLGTCTTPHSLLCKQLSMHVMNNTLQQSEQMNRTVGMRSQNSFARDCVIQLWLYSENITIFRMLDINFAPLETDILTCVTRVFFCVPYSAWYMWYPISGSRLLMSLHNCQPRVSDMWGPHNCWL
jgi:hypothetical protein